VSGAPALKPFDINIDPTLLAVGPLVITWHGFFTAVGTLVGVWLAIQWATRAGYTEDETLAVAMWGVGGAIVGARLFHVIDQWDYYRQHLLQIVLLNEGGIAIYGAIVGGMLTGSVAAWRKGLNVARLADVASIPFILGMAIGRIGDIINGEHHGAHAEGFPFAVAYTNPNTLGEIGLSVHLAVGYELLLDLAIFGVLVWLVRGVALRDSRLGWAWSPRYLRDGMLFWTYLALYSAGRFVVEFYRQDTIFALAISQSQLLSVIGATVGAGALLVLSARARGSRRMLNTTVP
jgi:phosphatidylglycerol:prolipoprotein diacylglycerol transferase